MKSWVSFLLPNDEYKEKRMLYFFAEGAIILFLALVVMVIWHKFFTISTGTAILIPIAIFLFYVSGRYILAGIEYADIATESSYKRELKSILTKTVSFVIIYTVLYIIFAGLPGNKNEWIEIIVLIASVGLLWFLATYISLKRSYKKNKELL